MLDRIVGWVKQRARGRPFAAFQIEVTTRCLARCAMCPRIALADAWPEMDLSWEAFQRIGRAFDQAQYVHLQGWGEPLLHPRLFDMIALAKGAGCRVSLTTNGMGLDPETGKRLLDLGLDLIAISIAGASRGTHESIRVGSDFPQILDNIRGLVTLRAGRRRRTPKVECSYLMTKTNLAELATAVELAASLGVDELFAINLDYVLTPAHDDLKAFGSSLPGEERARALDEAREVARRTGLTFRAYPLKSNEVAVCEAKPTQTLFLSADGWISPCTYLGLAGRTEIPRRFEGQPTTVARVRFGNILDQELPAIWGSPAYRAFRRQFAKRRMGVAAWALGAVSGPQEASDLRMPRPPEPCRTCYKLYGL